jgi:multidrug resistance efflux pump
MNELKDAQGALRPGMQGQHGGSSSAAPHRPSPLAGVLSQVRRHPLFFDAVFIFIVLAALGGIWLWQDMSGKIYIEKAQITAPEIAISAPTPGIIDKFYVEEGDEVSEGQRLALVGGQVISAKTRGTIIWVKNTPGQLAIPGDPIIKMIDPREMRVVGRIQEDKGLRDIRPGQKVAFTVDAFGQKQYSGMVDSVAVSAREGDIVFSISDKREEKEFDVSVLFDMKAYPELKNGMSARMWVYKTQES